MRAPISPGWRKHSLSSIVIAIAAPTLLVGTIGLQIQKPTVINHDQEQGIVKTA